MIDAKEIAQNCGNPKAVNTVLLGALSKMLCFEKDIWVKTIKDIVPPHTVELNLKAFEEGIKAIN